MLLEKLFVIGLTALFLWWAYPHVQAHEWIGPTVLPPDWWGLAQAPGYESWAGPEAGYGFYTTNAWNEPVGTPRAATNEDFTLRPLNQ